MIGDVILKNGDAWLQFTHPHRVIVTENINEVRKSLEEVERLIAKHGWHAAGFVSYEAAPAFDNALQVVKAEGFPLAWFGLYNAPRVLETCEVFKDFAGFAPLNWQPNVEKEIYNNAIRVVKEWIAQGQTYQVNYTMRLSADSSNQSQIKTDALGWQLFLHLAKSQNKYAAFLDIGDWEVCSASPELFFKLDGDRIFSRPMKGTVKRGRTTTEDQEQAEWLRNSIKNRAENVMIVDMVRNDLGRIAEIGSVQVPDLFTVEKYPTLFQMTSTVQAKTNASLTEIFSALFPCASITGAPKVSTMKIIAELETTPRKIYTGSIGYISPNRKAQFNVAIRTALIDKTKQQAEYGVGGGIVWDSTSADEYSEALLKSRVLTERPSEFSLFETLLWTPQDGYFLLEKHLERMRDSAEYFGFPYSRESMEEFLDELASAFTSPQRVKVSLSRLGGLDKEVISFQSGKRPYKVCLAKEPVNSGEVFLYHKTTRREVYNNALIVYQAYSDVLLYNEGNELTEFTIGNLVVEINGELFTPPIPCGLLAGTFRAHLLETNQVKERIIHKDELYKCSKIFLVNSLRKWVDVEIEKEPAL